MIKIGPKICLKARASMALQLSAGSVCFMPTLYAISNFFSETKNVSGGYIFHFCANLRVKMKVTNTLKSVCSTSTTCSVSHVKLVHIVI